MPTASPSHSVSGPHSCSETAVKLEVLLVDPEPDVLANRALLLGGSGYHVTTAASYLDVLRLHRNSPFALAILSDTLGSTALREVAWCVRSQWPSTRILIIGIAQSVLEDHLYDDAVEYRFEPKKLLESLVRLSEDPWNLRSKPSRLKAEGLGRLGSPDIDMSLHQTAPSESDPTKAAPHDWAEKGNSRDAPADTRGVGQAT